jgi:hypothetical protein
MERTLTEKICWAGFGLIVLAYIAMFIASCGTAEGVTRLERVKLNVLSNAPSRYINQPGGKVVGYRVYY